MKVFVWERVEKATNAYHSAGGVVVFAETEERARQLVNDNKPGCEIAPDEMPDEIRDVAGGGERVFVMPDAGCC